MKTEISADEWENLKQRMKDIELVCAQIDAHSRGGVISDHKLRVAAEAAIVRLKGRLENDLTTGGHG